MRLSVMCLYSLATAVYPEKPRPPPRMFRAFFPTLNGINFLYRHRMEVIDVA